MKTRSYSELKELTDFMSRYNYLKLDGNVGDVNTEVNRWLNQRFYHSSEWRRVRHQIIIRDNGFDLGIDGLVIFGRPMIHHIEPITMDDVMNYSRKLIDPDNLILVSPETHNAIHYGDPSRLLVEPVERKQGDTCLWR